MTVQPDPIHIVPRMLPRRWGKDRAPAWCAGAPRPGAPIGEIWLAHPNNVTREGSHLGALLSQAPDAMFGELGRAPPSLRLILTDEPSEAIVSEGAPSLWSILESPLDGVISVHERQHAAERPVRARRGDLFRTEPGVALRFCAGVTALEMRAHFTPNNAPSGPRMRRIASPDFNEKRAAWLRDAALSVEAWSLPELSYLEPNGETCHLIVALTPGVALDGQALSRGDAVFLPAEGRRAMLTGRGGQVLTVYPDIMPTEIWKQGRPPTPAALAIDPALLYAPQHDATDAHASWSGAARAAA